MWKRFGWTFPNAGKGFFNRNHSLNCGCAQCKGKTFNRRKENKSKRLKDKQELKKEVNDEIC